MFLLKARSRNDQRIASLKLDVGGHIPPRHQVLISHGQDLLGSTGAADHLDIAFVSKLVQAARHAQRLKHCGRACHLHGAWLDHFALDIDQVAGDALDDNADIRVGEEFFEFGSHLLLNCRYIQPGNIYAPGQGKVILPSGSTVAS